MTTTQHPLLSALKLVAMGFPLVIAPTVILGGWAAGIDLCPSRYVGLTCPGCGLGRASIALFSGDLLGAHFAHPLVLPCLFIVVWLHIWAAVTIYRPAHAAAFDPMRRLPTIFWLSFIFTLIFVWIGRSAGWLGLPPLA